MVELFAFLHYLNTNDKETTYARIINYLFTHLTEVSTLTITEIAERCYVSPATLTRFCRHFGISNFQTLRDSLVSLGSMKKHNGLRMKEQELKELASNPKDYLNSYGSEIITAINDVIQSVDLEQIDTVLADIHQAKEVVLLGYSATLDLAKDVQTSFLLCHKLVLVGETEAVQHALVDALTKNSVVLVLSSYGSILTRSDGLMRRITDSPAQSILITQHTQNTVTHLFDLAINVTKTNYVRIGNYPLSFFLDYLVRRYASLYP